MNAVGYARVSTATQAIEGLSLSAQAERVQGYCESRHWPLVNFYEDAGASGQTLERPGMQAALSALEAGAGDVLVATSLCRLTRSIVDQHLLMRLCGDLAVQLDTVEDSLETSSASGRFMANIHAAKNEYERERIGERTSVALQHKRGRGEWVGVPPFGFEVGGDGRLQPHPDELAVIRRMKRWRQNGWPVRRIAARLNAEGVPSRRGAWGKSTVHQLANEHLRTRIARYAAKQAR